MNFRIIGGADNASYPEMTEDEAAALLLEPVEPVKQAGHDGTEGGTPVHVLTEDPTREERERQLAQIHEATRYALQACR